MCLTWREPQADVTERNSIRRIMKNLDLQKCILGPVYTNCYFLKNKATDELVIIDPADCPEKIEQKVSQMNGKPVAVLLTHGHFDHIMAADEVRDKYNVKVYASAEEKNTLSTPHINLGEAYGMNLSVKADVWHNDGDILKLAGFDIKAIHTPGHTEGGTCYYIGSIGVLFSGDTLFCESVGRTDFPGGSMSDIVHSIKDKLMVLPDDTKVYTGHGEGTSIGYERVHNPYIGA